MTGRRTLVRAKELPLRIPEAAIQTQARQHGLTLTLSLIA
jgi:hypothetical protein